MLEMLSQMVWQDWVIGVGQIGLFLALIPTIRNVEKPALGTCVITAAILTGFAISFVTLTLWFSAFATSFAALGWYILLFQVWKRQE